MGTDWKTTVTGLVTALVTILAHFNVVVPDVWIPVIISIGVIILGWFSRDKK